MGRGITLLFFWIPFDIYVQVHLHIESILPEFENPELGIKYCCLQHFRLRSLPLTVSSLPLKALWLSQNQVRVTCHNMNNVVVVFVLQFWPLRCEFRELLWPNSFLVTICFEITSWRWWKNVRKSTDMFFISTRRPERSKFR